MPKMIETLHVKQRPNGKIHEGLLSFNDKTIHCCLGRSGITDNKKEGDGATPIGKFRLLYGFYRKDRLQTLQSNLGFSPIEKHYGWCDAPDHQNYNTLVELPFEPSHEIMTREDRLYNICIVLDYNIDPAISGKGSAIFFHLTSPELKPTEGCVAIDPEDMQALLPLLSDQTHMLIHKDN